MCDYFENDECCPSKLNKKCIISNVGSFKSFNEEPMSQKDMFQDKHNAFIDAIFARINKMLSDSYDPLNVQLSGRSKQFKGKSNDGKHQR